MKKAPRGGASREVVAQRPACQPVWWPAGVGVVDFGGVVVRFWWRENDDGAVEWTYEPRDKIVGLVDTATNAAR